MKYCYSPESADSGAVVVVVVVTGAGEVGEYVSDGSVGSGRAGSALKVVVWTMDTPVMANTAPTPALAHSSFTLFDVMPGGLPAARLRKHRRAGTPSDPPTSLPISYPVRMQPSSGSAG